MPEDIEITEVENVAKDIGTKHMELMNGKFDYGCVWGYESDTLHAIKFSDEETRDLFHEFMTTLHPKASSEKVNNIEDTEDTEEIEKD
jgi:hypothetical protein